MEGATATASGELSPSAYFRKILGSNPKLLKDRKNDRIYEIWKKDHPGNDPVPKNVMQILSNIKSLMRKERKASRGSKAREEAAENHSAPVRASRSITKNLEHLEELLDDCVMLALDSGKDELESVIVLLRKARREVGIKLGM